MLAKTKVETYLKEAETYNDPDRFLVKWAIKNNYIAIDDEIDIANVRGNFDKEIISEYLTSRLMMCFYLARAALDTQSDCAMIIYHLRKLKRYARVMQVKALIIWLASQYTAHIAIISKVNHLLSTEIGLLILLKVRKKRGVIP